MSRAPNHEFQEWWNKQRERSLDLSSSHDGGPLLPVEIRTPRSDQAVEKSRARSVPQLSWVCLLRFQQIASLFACAAGSLVSILRTANRRIAASPADSSSSRLYRIIRFFLILVLVLLGFALLAYSKGWHFSPPSVGSKEVLGFVELVYANWLEIRAKYVAPPLQSLIDVCTVLFLIQSVDRVVSVLVTLWIKIKRIKPVASVDYEKKGDLDSESGDAVHPMVLVQIPMCNEKEVAEANENSDAKRCKHNESVGNENRSGKAEHDPKESTGTASEDKQTKDEVKDYIHVRARRGQATDSHSLAERVRREKISDRMKFLQDLVPGCNKVTGKAVMLDQIINYVQSLQRQVEFLSMKLASVNTSPDYKVDALMSKEMFQSNDAIQYPIFPPDSSAASVLFSHRQHQKNLAVHNSIKEGTTAQYPMDPLNDLQFAPLDGSTDHDLVTQSFCGDDPQMLVQMGFGRDDTIQYPVLPPDSSAASVLFGHRQHQKNPAIHNSIKEGTVAQYPMDPLNDPQFAPLDGSNDHVLASFRGDDPQMLVQMGFGRDDAIQYPVLPPDSSAASVLFGHRQHQKNPAVHNSITEGTTAQYPMDPLNDPQFAPLDGSNDHVLASFCGDDPQMLVQMGFGRDDAIQYPVLPPDSSAASMLFGHRQHQKNPAVHNSITEGTTAQYPMDPLNDPHFAPLDGSNNHVLASFCGDDLQMLVQMGFGRDALTETALDHQDYHGQTQVSHMKIEL